MVGPATSSQVLVAAIAGFFETGHVSVLDTWCRTEDFEESDNSMRLMEESETTEQLEIILIFDLSSMAARSVDGEPVIELRGGLLQPLCRRPTTPHLATQSSRRTPTLGGISTFLLSYVPKVLAPNRKRRSLTLSTYLHILGPTVACDNFLVDRPGNRTENEAQPSVSESIHCKNSSASRIQISRFFESLEYFPSIPYARNHGPAQVRECHGPSKD